MTEHALEISGLTKTYQNGLQALKGIDFTVEKGEFFALLGPNGAGKSTTIGILTSLVEKTAGTVRVMGYDLDTEPSRVKSAIGVVPQEFNFGIFENPIDIVVNQAGYYGVPYKEAKPYAEHLLETLQLTRYLKTPAKQLSGGLKRRLMIARGLVHRPDVFLLDEPTAGVDIELRHLIWDFLQAQNQEGTTIILTTHYLEEAEYLCNHLGIISQGEMVAHGPMRHLLGGLTNEAVLLEITEPPAQLPTVSGYQWLWDPKRGGIVVDLQRGQSLNPIMAACLEADIEVLSTRVLQNRLERLFLEVTGKRTG